MKVLILRFSSIGDIVLTTPVVRTLKTQLEEARIHYATKIQYSSLFEVNPYIDKMHFLKDSITDLIRELKDENFDYIIDLHHNLRTLRIKQSLRVKSFSYNKLNIEKWLLVNLKINKLPDVHIVDRYMETVKPLGVKMDALGLDYFIPEKDEVPLDWLPPEFQNGYVAYAIGAQHNTKKLPLKRIIELCEKINKPIVLLGGKEDDETGGAVMDFFKKQLPQINGPKIVAPSNNTVVYNACGKFSLNQSASIVKQARHVFSHDTGLMHIAAAFRKDVYSLWGSTIPSFGMYPYRTKFVVLEKVGLSCRPCSKIGYFKCPKGHFKCMNEIVFDFYLP
ncbi:glycosyltransferase family 9 protein [soil metagenome]